MCNGCFCPNIDKCSARGFGSTGWCCNRCENYDPISHCLHRYDTKIAEKLLTSEEIKRKEILNLCFELEN